MAGSSWHLCRHRGAGQHDDRGGQPQTQATAMASSLGLDVGCPRGLRGFAVGEQALEIVARFQTPRAGVAKPAANHPQFISLQQARRAASTPHPFGNPCLQHAKTWFVFLSESSFDGKSSHSRADSVVIDTHMLSSCFAITQKCRCDPARRDDGMRPALPAIRCGVLPKSLVRPDVVAAPAVVPNGQHSSSPSHEATMTLRVDEASSSACARSRSCAARVRPSYFAIVMPGPTCSAVDTLIWNSW